jgi:hypothetical protein
MLVNIIRRSNKQAIAAHIPRRQFNSRQFDTGPITLDMFPKLNPALIAGYDPKEKVDVQPVDFLGN